MFKKGIGKTVYSAGRRENIHVGLAAAVPAADTRYINSLSCSFEMSICQGKYHPVFCPLHDIK